MESLGDQLFAGSALALQKDRGAAGRNLRYQVEDLQHGLALAHDVFKVVTLLQSALELNVFCFSLVAAYCDANVRQQLFVVPWFLDEVGGAGLHRLHRIFHRAIGGDHDHGKLWIMRVKSLQAGPDRCDPAMPGRAGPGQTDVPQSASDPDQRSLPIQPHSLPAPAKSQATRGSRLHRQ